VAAVAAANSPVSVTRIEVCGRGHDGLRGIGAGKDPGPAATLPHHDRRLPGSGEETPPDCQRPTFFPDVSAHEAVTDLVPPR
jgi:hypothetical protein